MAATEQDMSDTLGDIDYDAERSLDETKDPTALREEYMASDNIAELLSEDELGRLGAKVSEEYDIDVVSRSEWTSRNEKAMKLAKQVVESKTYPWPKASNIKYPLITVAAIQYNQPNFTGRKLLENLCQSSDLFKRFV